VLILGIESSCDETAVALVENGKTVVGSLVHSQIDTHKVFGGVVPEVAAREHLKYIDPLMRELLEKSGKTIQDVDAIAVTQGPGLIGALLVGISYAKALASATEKPLIPINHVHAHVHGALLGVEESHDNLFPLLALVVSGGHTNLYYMARPNTFELIAYSIDDACGESFDKVAKLFKLGYPGGPIVEKTASTGKIDRFEMPKMMNDASKMLFSYSGLKTHMVNLRHRLRDTLTQTDIADLCAGFQNEALGQIVRKLKSASRSYPNAKSILISGGVAANQQFRKLTNQQLSLPVFFPDLRYCSDNAAMIAALAYHEFIAARDEEHKFSFYNWDAFSRYQF
jgi:N6-L-threonylcarbamoyladenine synthase